MGTFASKADYHYQTLRTNVNALKLIQLGITLFNAEGETPPAQPDTPLLGGPQANNLTPCPTTWQFNFHFDRNQDMCAEESLRLLSNAGIDFDRHVDIGIDHMDFGSLLITSGLVLDPSVKWLSFHSGYDFGYLLKIMSQAKLPNEHEQFMKLLTKWFPHVIDIKFLWKDAQRRSNRGLVNTTVSNFLSSLGYKSGLEDLAEELGCKREGRAHTAGSDAWLTGSTYWSLRERIFEGVIPDDLVGQLWGLSAVPPPASAATHAAFAGSQTPNTNGATLYHHQSGMTPSTIRTSEGPATPQGAQSSLASNTPGGNNMGYSNAGAGGMGLTGGGAFSNFQYGR